jgi:hypothetical protein
VTDDAERNEIAEKLVELAKELDRENDKLKSMILPVIDLSIGRQNKEWGGSEWKALVEQVKSVQTVAAKMRDSINGTD